MVAAHVRDDRNAKHLARKHGRPVAQRLVVDVNQIGLEAPGHPQRLRKRRQEIRDVVQAREKLVGDPTQTRNDGGPTPGSQGALHRYHVDVLVRDMAPTCLGRDSLVLGVAKARDDHGLELPAVQVAHEVAQANDGAPVADAVLDKEHTLRGAQQPPVQRLVLVSHRGDRITLQHQRTRLLAHATGVAGQASLQRSGELAHVIGCVGVAGHALDDQLAAAAGSGSHTRQATGHGLKHHVGQALLGRRQDQHIGAVVVGNDVGLVVEQTNQAGVLARDLGNARANFAVHRVAALRSHGKQQSAGTEALMRDPLLGQPGDVLTLVKNTDVKRDRLAWRQRQLGAQASTHGGRHRAESIGIHAVGQVVNA